MLLSILRRACHKNKLFFDENSKLHEVNNQTVFATQASNKIKLLGC